MAIGLGAGGQGIFVLDVTDPTRFTQANASAIARWEFSDVDDADMGYTFSQPLLVKTNNGRWSVIVGNGYNNSEDDDYDNNHNNKYATMFKMCVLYPIGLKPISR